VSRWELMLKVPLHLEGDALRHLLRIDFGLNHWEDHASMTRWVWVVYQGDHKETEIGAIYKNNSVLLRTNHELEWWQAAEVLQHDVRLQTQEVWEFQAAGSQWRSLK
jgi:hypothetical protein